MSVESPTWIERNQQQLGVALAAILARLDAYATADAPLGDEPALVLDVPSLDAIGALFNLSEFERGLVLLAGAVELSSSVALACSLAHGDARRPHATFGLALATLPGAFWSAISPDAPLRRWRLVHVENGGSLTQAAVRLDERILHLLAGVDGPDAALAPFVTVVPTTGAPLPRSQQAIADTVVATWRAANAGTSRARSAHLYGAERDHLRAVSDGIAAAIGAATTLVVDPVALPPPGPELETVVAAMERECLLTGSLLVVEPVPSIVGDDLHSWFVRSLLERPPLTIIVASRERVVHDGRVVALAVPHPTLAERRGQWRDAVGAGDRSSDRVAAGFTLSPRAIQAVAEESRARPATTLWTICRERVRTDVGGSARVIVPAAGWDGLVLPEESARQLLDIVEEAAHRAVVHDQWGFARPGARGGGTTALFCGPSGTGKTMAAEVIAKALEVDLYHVDLSQVVNKYIGETEKNLARVFDAGERGGAVLLFDEADALFGKRTEVKDSHDRYANIEVSYLLQRMEAYRGVALLTTNLRANLDPAFVRRLRFIVPFPHPDEERRRTIWEQIFPPGVPTEGIDFAGLARLDVTGGTIKNIALSAAYRAAADAGAVTMAHLRHAAEGEYRKLDRPITETELKGWR